MSYAEKSNMYETSSERKERKDSSMYNNSQSELEMLEILRCFWRVLGFAKLRTATRRYFIYLISIYLSTKTSPKTSQVHCVVGGSRGVQAKKGTARFNSWKLIFITLSSGGDKQLSRD